ncbi:MAG: DNA integrity scanning protein DisA nucleotide-binding domain protein [Deltaproteobacteria bacterium]|nr:DNA integrity scanning protein DisA nucleotide-binding domain protein [Deltaproteobacteria bacterium]
MHDLFYSVSGVRWQDVVDIGLNSYILFRLYVLFRGTNAFRVLVGMVLLWFFQRMAASVGLIVTSWAAQGIIAAAAIIIVVVFRNEIHSVLQTRKLKALLWGSPHKAVQTPPEVIASTVFELSRMRIGALIVLPGKEDVTEVVQDGVPWQGVLSREMLMSVFWPENPVHDGAVIIQADRIETVGVILPLSLQKDLPSHFGTRHRAALGMAETTDATVIVVSEENGSVHIAQNGGMRIIRRQEELAKALWDRPEVSAGIVGKNPKETLRLGAAAVVSVLFVTGVWFSFSRGLESLTTLEVPIEYMNRNAGVEILDTSLNAVRLHLAGSGTLIKSLQPEQVQVRIDLKNATVGDNTFIITPDDISLPPGVLLRKIEQPTIHVTLDVPMKKTLPIQVDWTGKLPRGLALTRVTIRPETTQVIGGSRILNKISTLYTEKVRLNNIEKSGILTASLVLTPASVRLAPGEPDSVTVVYEVKKR